MPFVKVSKRLIFYCVACDRNPREQPAEHSKRTGHQEQDRFFMWAPDLTNIPKCSVKA